MGYVTDNWLVNVDVNLNTFVAPVASFNQSLICCVVQPVFVPTSFGTSVVQLYTNYADISAEFTPIETSALISNDVIQANRVHTFLEACYQYFTQVPTPTSLWVGIIPYNSNSPANYAAGVLAIAAENISWYSFFIADEYLPSAFSYVLASITCSAATTIPAGTQLLPKTASSFYTTLERYDLSAGGYPSTIKVVFYSEDATTAIPANTFTSISPAIATVTAVTNASSAVNNCPGVMTGTGNINGLMASLSSIYGPKFNFWDTNNPAYAGQVQSLGGNERILANYYTYNNQPHSSSNTYSLSGAGLGAYFPPLFSSSVAIKTYALQQLSGLPADPTVTNATIGDVTLPGGSNNYIGWNNNVYAGIGNASVSLLEYGTVTSSTASKLIYLDQIVAVDYLQLSLQANLKTLIVGSQPTGPIPYTNAGIQKLIANINKTLQTAVDLNIIQQFQPSDIVYQTYEQVKANNPGNISSRIYNGIVCNLVLVNYIQRISININLSL